MKTICQSTLWHCSGEELHFPTADGTGGGFLQTNVPSSSFFPTPGSQISCFPPGNFSGKQSSYMDAVCWDSLLHHDVDSAGSSKSFWILKVCRLAKFGAIYAGLVLSPKLSLERRSSALKCTVLCRIQEARSLPQKSLQSKI